MLILFFSLSVFILSFFYWRFIPFKKQSLFLLLCSLIFTSLFSVIYAAYFLFMTGAVYCAGNLITKSKKWGKTIFIITLFLLISNLLLHKYFLGPSSKMFFSPLNNSIKILWPLGISYLTFRLIHYTVEVYRKNVPTSSLVDFALYVLFFPTFLAGPVERFQRFHPQTTEHKSMDISNINYGLFRIMCGMIKKFIIADNLAKLIMPVLHSPKEHVWTIVVLSIYGLAIRIYMDFSGYTDMAIGIARLFGYKIMENFNRPYFQKNIALFWRNWHISVYSWIRDYFFLPVFGYRSSNIKIYVGIFCTMILFHLWHIISINFLILGFYHGLGLAVWQFFQEVKKRYPFIRQLTTQRFLDPVSTFFTFSFVSFGFIFFNLDMYNINNILHNIF